MVEYSLRVRGQLTSNRLRGEPKEGEDEILYILREGVSVRNDKARYLCSLHRRGHVGPTRYLAAGTAML